MKTNKPFIFAKTKIEPGTKQSILFPAPNINTQVNMYIPVHVFHGKYAGPKFFVVGMLHGDELNSVEIIRRVHKYIKVSHLHGTLITVPVANVYGFVTESRYLPDGRDLNRNFPGAKKGTLAKRLARGVLDIISQCDFGVDLHTGGVGHINLPQLRINFKTSGAKKLAIAFDAPVILDAKLRDGSLRQAASQRGIPILVYEGGEALRFNELCIRAGTKGVLNVLSHLSMIPSLKASQSKKKPLLTTTSRWIRATVSGFVQPVGKIIGKSVKKNTILAYIYDPFLINAPTKVLAPFDGLVIGQGLKPLASEGDALFHIASFKKILGLDQTMGKYPAEIRHDDLLD